MSISSLIDDYERGPDAVAKRVRDSAALDIDAYPDPNRWSIREVVCHLADAEIIYADRIKRVLAEDNPTFFEADPNDFLPSLHVTNRPLKAELQVIISVRSHMVSILRSLSTTEYERFGQHSLAGQMSVEDLLQRITDHIPHHVAFIDAKISSLQTPNC